MFRKELVFKRSVFLQVFHQGYWVKVESAVSTYRRIGKCSCFGRRRGSLLWHTVGINIIKLQFMERENCTNLDMTGKSEFYTVLRDQML